LDGAELPSPDFTISEKSTVDLLVHLVRNSVMPISSRDYPELLMKFKDLTFIRGSAGCGNRLPTAKFNIWADREAADIVVRIGSLKFFALTYDEVFGVPRPPLHDPVAVAVLAEPSIVKSRMVSMEVELNRDLTRGATVVDLLKVMGRSPNIEVALDLNVELFWQEMLTAIAEAASQITR
jgi:inosine-uridine nucleoside N-ribohydrolase